MYNLLYLKTLKEKALCTLYVNNTHSKHRDMGKQGLLLISREVRRPC